MSGSTNKVPITDSAYTDVSDGNTACALFVKTNQKLRVIVGDYGITTGPDSDDPEHFVVSGGSDNFTGYRLVMSFNNLPGEDDVYVRSEKGDDDVVVVRGDTVVSGNR